MICSPSGDQTGSRRSPPKRVERATVRPPPQGAPTTTISERSMVSPSVLDGSGRAVDGQAAVWAPRRLTDVADRTQLAPNMQLVSVAAVGVHHEGAAGHSVRARLVGDPPPVWRGGGLVTNPPRT